MRWAVAPFAHLLAAVLLAGAATAHDAAAQDPAAPDPVARSLPPAEGLALPIPVGGPFRLTDQFGQERTEADPEGRLQLLFFGYAHCEAICTIALPQMGALTARLRARGIAVRPVMVTVDPQRDTPAVMARALGALDPDFLGLTGPSAALAAAYRAFGVENEVVFTDPAGHPVYAHGSLIYLLDGDGRFLTMIPPILSNDRAEEIVAAFAAGG